MVGGATVGHDDVQHEAVALDLAVMTDHCNAGTEIYSTYRGSRVEREIGELPFLHCSIFGQFINQYSGASE